jgi:hypothetical protein
MGEGEQWEDEERAERGRQFSRRELLRVGMAVPAVLSLPMIAAACDGGSSTAAGHSDHTDSGSHSDHADHSDAGHNDTSHEDSAHTDSSHSDKGHTDTTHSDTTHNDTTHSDTTHSDTAHTDKAHTDATPGHSDHADNFGQVQKPQHFDAHYDKCGVTSPPPC